MPRNFQLIGLLLFFLPWLNGCGSPTPAVYPVHGRVIFEDGEPARLGNVEFRAPDRTIARGKIAEDGRFQLTTFRPGDGALSGMHQVIVSQLVITKDLTFAEHNHGRRILPMYGDYGTSPLRFEVKKTDAKTFPVNEIVIRLKISEADIEDD